MIDFSQLTPYQPELAWAWLWPVLSFAASALTSLFATKSANKSNKELMEQQNAFNEQMMDKQNAYNSPKNQKQLYEEAGINPAFLFGGQSGLDATSGMASSSGLPTMQAPDLGISDSARLFLDSQRVKNETLRTQVDTEKTIQETERFKIENSKLQEQLEANIANIKADTSLKDEDKNLRIKQAETEVARKREVLTNTMLLDSNIQYVHMKARTEGWSQRKLAAEIDRLVTLTPLEAKEISSRANLNNEQSRVAVETVNKFQYEIKNMIKQGKSIDLTNYSSYLDNALKEVATANKMSIEELKSEDEFMNLIYSECDGWFGNAVKGVASFVHNPNSDYLNRRKRVSHRMYDDTSFLFNE